MILVHQDRDAYVAYSEDSVLAVAPVVHDGIYFGHNVYCDDVMLGTYDDCRGALREMARVRGCSEPAYCVAIG
jgi:hypothetical protein